MCHVTFIMGNIALVWKHC